MKKHNKLIYSTNFFYNDYLSNLDLIHKYQTKNIFKLPKCKNINLSLNLNFLTNLSKNGVSNQLFKLTFFYLFCSFNSIPYINSTASYSSSGSQKVLNTSYRLTLDLSTQKQKNFYLFFIFCEKWKLLKKYNFVKKLNKALTTVEPKNISTLHIQYPFAALDNYDIFYSFLNNLSLTEDVFFQVMFNFSNLNKKAPASSIKNLPFFWKN